MLGFSKALTEINSLVISDVIIENEIYLLQEYFYPLRHPAGDHPPHGQSPWGGIFAKPDKVRQQFVILSEVEKKSPKAISVDLRFGKDKELPRLATSLQSTPSFLLRKKRRGMSDNK